MINLPWKKYGWDGDFKTIYHGYACILYRIWLEDNFILTIAFKNEVILSGFLPLNIKSIDAGKKLAAILIESHMVSVNQEKEKTQ